MSVNIYSDKIEIFKFRSTGWHELFDEVYEFRKKEAEHGRKYWVTYVGPDINDDLIVRLEEKLD